MDDDVQEVTLDVFGASFGEEWSISFRKLPEPCVIFEGRMPTEAEVLMCFESGGACGMPVLMVSIIRACAAGAIRQREGKQ